MAGKKVLLTYIANENSRRQSLKQRRLGLVKKVSELATLCDVKALIIIYSPNEPEPLVWPSHAEVQQQLEEFLNIPGYQRDKRMTDEETYLKERLIKLQQQAKRIHLKNKEIEMNNLMHQIHQGKALGELSLVEIQDLICFVEGKMKYIYPFVQSKRRSDENLPLPSQGPTNDLTTQINNMGSVFGGDIGMNTSESLLGDQWFTGLNHNQLNAVVGTHVAEDLRLPQHSLDVNSHIAAEIGQPQYGNFGGLTTNMGLPPLPSTPHAGATTNENLGNNFIPFKSNSAGPFRDMRSNFAWSEIGHGIQESFEPIGSNLAESEIGLPHLGFIPQAGAVDHMRLPNYGSVISNSFGLSERGVGYGRDTFEKIGSSFAGSELGQPFVPFEGTSNNGASNDIELPFHGNVYPTNFAS